MKPEYSLTSAVENASGLKTEPGENNPYRPTHAIFPKYSF
jgi:hypothetical protein